MCASFMYSTLHMYRTLYSIMYTVYMHIQYSTWLFETSETFYKDPLKRYSTVRTVLWYCTLLVDIALINGDFNS